ncbi:MAG: hypothetical protein Q7V63_00175 [Gammaproteobacteria bacterium]|nr:hypothetical protein [Gammaproteobacteria bacterium]
MLSRNSSKQIKNLTAELKKLKLDLGLSDEINKERLAEIEMLLSNNSELRSELALASIKSVTAEHENSVLREMLVNTEAKLESAKIEAKEAKKHHEHAIEHAITASAAKVKAQRDVLAAWAKRIAERKANINAREIDLKRKVGLLKSNLAELVALRDELATTKAVLSEAKAEPATLREELAVVTETSLKAKAEATALREEIAILKEALLKAKSEPAASPVADSKLLKANAEIARLNERLVESNAIQFRLLDLLEERQERDIKKYKALSAEHNDSINSMQTKIESLQYTIHELLSMAANHVKSGGAATTTHVVLRLPTDSPFYEASKSVSEDGVKHYSISKD